MKRFFRRVRRFIKSIKPKRPSKAEESASSTLATPAKRSRVAAPIPSSRETQSTTALSHLKAQMNRLTKPQKEQVKNFVQWTQSNEAVAMVCLQKCGWSTEMAVDMYYNNPQLMAQQQNQNVDKYRLDGMFNSYANDPRDDVGPKRIGPNGVQRLLNDLHIEPDDRRVLILCCKLKAATQCEFSWEEFQSGLTELKCDTIDGLRSKLDQLDKALAADKPAFRELYNFTFVYGKPAGQRSMELDHALVYWKILFKELFPLLDLWEEFLTTEHGKGITQDTWKLLLDFCFTINPDLSNFDDDGAWPLLIDQFVDYARNKLAQDAA